jgi:hypothetical protein
VCLGTLAFLGVTGGPTEASDSRGTAYCTAPEILNDEAGDHRADLWSVGAMMYALMTMRDVDLGDPEEPLEIPPRVARAQDPAGHQRRRHASARTCRAALSLRCGHGRGDPRCAGDPKPPSGALPLWASIAGMALTAGLATVGSLVSMGGADAGRAAGGA